MVSSRRRALRTPPRQTRAKPTISYAESSGDGSDSFDEHSEAEAEEPSPPQPQIARPRRNVAPTKGPSNKRSRPATPSHARSSKRRRQTKPVSPKSHSNTLTNQIVGSGIIPKWQTLPYHILMQIFRFASYPLYDDQSFHPLPSSKWLLSAGRMCRAFAEPAFTVLYSSPPLVPMIAAHLLVDLLKADPLPMAYKYRQKVESLRIEVRQVAAYSLPGSGHLDLHGLIKDLPRLVDLEFYHQKDMARFGNLDENIKWTYPESIFEALEYIDPTADPVRGDKVSVCKLRSWRWSSRMAGRTWSLEKLSEVHMKMSFQSLQKIAFVNYQVPQVKVKKDEEAPNDQAVLANAIKVLPNLEHLVFESSTLVDSTLLSLLPTNLRNLEIINCWEVLPEDFSEFILTHGRQLRCLTLNHNQSLSLGFLPVLGNACPNLQSLRMNLRYYNIHSSYRNPEPIYDHLLLPEQVPDWPSKLQTIELMQMRKWEREAVEVFFKSLLDSAGSLPDLRKLHIQAIIDIPWRDRASFRDQWIGSLNRVFKRVSPPPMILQTVRPVAATTPVVEIQEEPESATTKGLSKIRIASTLSSTNVDEPCSPRRSTRARKTEAGAYAESSDDDTPLATIRQSPNKPGRLARELSILRATAGIDYPAQHQSTSGTFDDDAPLVGKSEKGKGKGSEVIQGMCESVEVRIDNLRPTEHQVTEADFMDSEKSGDEDWDGNDGGEEGYAW